MMAELITLLQGGDRVVPHPSSEAIHDQLQEKFGSKGARVVEDNMRVVKRGFDEIQEVVAGPLTEGSLAGKGAGSEPPIPMMAIRLFWEN